METTNYAEKYSSIVDERFSLASVTNDAVNKDYEFDGVNKINVYSVETAPLNNYNRTANSNRYGTPSELGDAVQSMTLTQDKSFAFTIDRGDYSDKVMANSAGNALNRQINEVVTPTIDKYRLSKICSGAGKVFEQEITTANAYESFLIANAYATEAKVPITGRVAYVTTEYLIKLKLDEAFTGKADKVNNIASNGTIETVDKVSIKPVPSDYLPENVNFMITHPSATLGPVKLAEYKTHENPPGVSGWLCEGRVYYDAFVLNNKKDAIIVSKKPATT